MLNICWCGRKYVVRCAGSGPDLVKIIEAWVEPGADCTEVTDRGNAANGKTGLRADQCGVCLAQRLSGEGRGLGQIDLTTACRYEQQGRATGFATKDDAFCDLVDLALDGVGGVLCRAGQSGFDDGDIQTCGLQGGADSFQAFAHGEKLRGVMGECKAKTKAGAVGSEIDAGT